MSNRFVPPGERRGKRGESDTYPDVVGEGARSEKGLGAPTAKRRPDKYPIVVGSQEQRRAADRAAAKTKWKPPVDRPPRPALSEYPRISNPAKYEDPRRPVRVPPVWNPDGSVWRPPVDDSRPRERRDTYPQIVGTRKIGKVQKFRPPHPRQDWNYRGARLDPDSQYYANCVGLTGEGLRQYLSYDPAMGELTWLPGSGPRTGQTVPHNPNCVVTFKRVPRNVYAVIYLIMLDRLPQGWVTPANGAGNDWSWDNIRPTERLRPPEPDYA